MKDTNLYSLIENARLTFFSPDKIYQLITQYVLRPKPEVIELFCNELEKLSLLWAGKDILYPLQSLGSNLAYGVLRMSYPSYDKKWDRHKLIARSCIFFQRLKIELLRRSLHPHLVFVDTFIDRIFSWSRALEAIREIDSIKVNNRAYRGILIERLVIAASFATRVFALLLHTFVRGKNKLEPLSFKKILSCTISEAMQNPWQPVLSNSDRTKGIDIIADNALATCHPLKINQLLSMIVNREVLSIGPEVPSQFVIGLTKNKCFKTGAKHLIEITPY